MKYDTAPRFNADFKRLPEHEQALFLDAVHTMIEASRREAGRIPRWPASLRIRQLSRWKGLYEMTWSFAGPDGRATFEVVWDGSEPILRWRRVGGHEIFLEP